ncbi:fibronectin type III domain-containing protein [Streptomyces sp. ATE26]|uniref:fibronectin type III domain-containing protein n=1 Tax=Streptomyces sp. ATE26 TaxID=2954237 RepID=UPI002482139D|nr:fibronectin type III domain-containing protein [Streptomyces sp. ATE26]MDI1455515.1 fibronectin type III domain-containing protein [Streptomyces sp. ATE26]
MRRAPLRPLLVSAALLLVASCGWGGAEDDGGRAPGAPTGVTAAAGSASSVHVMWNAVTDGPGVRVYEVYRGRTKAGEVPGSQHMVDVTRLRPSTMYSFTVRARDTDGRLGPPSRAVRARTPAAAAADRSAPTRPGRPAGRAAGSRAVRLSWSASRDDRGVVSYEIEQGGARIHSVGGGQSATVVTGLGPGTRYVFTVRARDAADNLSPASAPVRVTTPGADDGRDTAPTAFTASSHRSGGAYYFDLSWDPPAVDGVVTEYRIQLDGATATSLVWGGEPPRGRAHYSFFAGRKAGEEHRVRLGARLPDGTWGGFSAERTVVLGGGAGG